MHEKVPACLNSLRLIGRPLCPHSSTYPFIHLFIFLSIYPFILLSFYPLILLSIILLSIRFANISTHQRTFESMNRFCVLDGATLPHAVASSTSQQTKAKASRASKPPSVATTDSTVISGAKMHAFWLCAPNFKITHCTVCLHGRAATGVCVWLSWIRLSR
jgi:hypothetical protein